MTFAERFEDTEMGGTGPSCSCRRCTAIFWWNAALEEAAKMADLESNCGDDRHGNTASAAIRKLKETP
jgi:hypothetical protein